jgi:hypothetical protein
MEPLILDLLEKIRPRPELYLGKKSVSLLRAFLDGYRTAIDETANSGIEHKETLSFHDWVAMKAGFREDTSGWNNVLLETEGGDEEKAFAKFFVYLDEYKSRNAKVICEAVPEKGRSWRYSITNGEKIETPLPSLVQIVTYDEGSKGVFVKYLGKNGELVDREEYCWAMFLAYLRTDNLIKRTAWSFHR